MLTQIVFAQKTPKTEKIITLTGQFESKQGVMTTLSCYCYEGGEVTTSKNEIINICLKGVENADDAQNCTKISVKGYYVNVTNDAKSNSSCPKGTMRYFKVISYECLGFHQKPTIK